MDTSTTSDWLEGKKHNPVPRFYWMSKKCPASFRIPQQHFLPIGPACRSAENNKQDRVKTVGMDAGKRDFIAKIIFIYIQQKASQLIN